MKDYYYILGVNRDCSLDEIKKGYRKLSIKFHPDKNDGDSFFADRFKEIQEAYEVLSNTAKRAEYDLRSEKKDDFKESNVNYLPIIEYFRSNADGFEYDKEITFTWKCLNSDYCNLSPFGKVPSVGTKTIRIKNLEVQFLNVELKAFNNYLDKNTSATLRLKNITYSKLREKIINEYKNTLENEYFRKKQDPTRRKFEDSDRGVFGESGMWILIAGIIFVTILALVFN